jgi:glutathione S-transferase
MPPPARPILYLFAISHYCEKARWAVDHCGIGYEPRFVMPGVNRSIAKKLGAKSGSLPFMHTASGVVAGSAAVIDWADAHRGTMRQSLAGADSVEVRDIEQRLDDVLGVHVRRFYYSDALINDPASVRPIFSRGLPLLQKITVTTGWSQIVRVMIRWMDLGPQQGRESRDIVESELDWLDGLLSDGRPFLTGQQFTRADITAASLLAPFVTPETHPMYANQSLAWPEAAGKTVALWKDRPALKWVKQVYGTQR